MSRTTIADCGNFFRDRRLAWMRTSAPHRDAEAHCGSGMFLAAMPLQVAATLVVAASGANHVKPKESNMSHRSSKMLPLVLAMGVALAMAGCRDRDDPNASQAGMTGQAEAAQPATADTAPPPNDATMPPASPGPASPDQATAAGAMDGTSSATAPTGATQPGAAGMDSDKTFVRTALADSMAEVSISRYVASKAKSGEVRSLAKRIADDHEALNAKLRTAAGSDADAVQLDDTAKTAEAIIRGRAGAELDKTYLMHMAEDHKQDIARFEAAAAQATDPAVRKLAEDTLPTLREHAKLVDACLAAMK